MAKGGTGERLYKFERDEISGTTNHFFFLSFLYWRNNINKINRRFGWASIIFFTKLKQNQIVKYITAQSDFPSLC